MDRVIISVKRDGDKEAHDLEVPSNLPIRQLASVISRSLGWAFDAKGCPIHYDLAAQPPGRILGDDETLAQVGAWDGSWLVFYRKQLSPVDTKGPMKGLVGTWKSIETSESNGTGGTDHTTVNVPWKQLDE